MSYRHRHIRTMWLLAVLTLLICEAATAQRQIPSAPMGLTIEIIEPTDPLGGYGAELSWPANPREEGVTNYKVYIKEVGEWGAGQGVFEFFGETSETSMTFAPDQFNFGGAAYAFYVSAVNGAGESEPSNIVSSACGRAWNDGDLDTYNGTGTSQIVTQPPLSVELGEVYRYDLNTVADYSEAVENRPAYGLTRAPEGMTINSETGEIDWEPNAPGTYTVVATAAIPEIDESDQQVWRVTVTASVSGVNDREQRSLSAQIFPNPVADEATLRFASSGGRRTVSLIDSRGAEVFRTTVATTKGMNSFLLDVADRAIGAYTVIVRGEEETTTVPFNLVR